jgi:hypothetical protein
VASPIRDRRRRIALGLTTRRPAADAMNRDAKFLRSMSPVRDDRRRQVLRPLRALWSEASGDDGRLVISDRRTS